MNETLNNDNDERLMMQINKLQDRIIELEHFEPEKADNLKRKLEFMLRCKSDLNSEKYRENKPSKGLLGNSWVLQKQYITEGN